MNINSVFDSITFDILSTEDIKQMSVVEINTTKLQGPNSVYDERLGPTIISKNKCITCNQIAHLCAGHFGHITLSYPIFHPLFEKEIIKLLNIFCFNCHKLMYTDETENFDITKTKVDKISICPFCNLKQPIWNVDENQEVFITVIMTLNDNKICCTPYDILNMFENYSQEDLDKINFKIKPQNLIIQLLPILPPSTRPMVILEDKYCDDDLTIQYIEIIKVNKNIELKKENGFLEIEKYLKILYFRISSLFNNSSGKSKHNTNGKVIKGIKERLATKNGLMRENLMGKRVEQSARTVIGPDPTLCMNELSIPEEFSKILTIPERVNQHNIDKLTKLVQNGKANFIKKISAEKKDEIHEINLQYALKKKGTRLIQGDIIIRNGREIKYDSKMNLLPNDFIIRDNSLIPFEPDITKEIKLEIGDIIERCLQDGDYLILNRQPTLHSGSMIAQKIKIKPNKTLRFSLCITKSLNADFDGDEGNIHVPQQPNTIIEMEELSSVSNHILSQQSGNANIVLVQDNLLSLYLITYENRKLTKEEFYDICMVLVNEQSQQCSMEELRNKFKHLQINFNCPYYDSINVLSLCFPKTFTFEKDNCLIDKGKWIKGFFTKKIMSQIIKTLYHVYGSVITMMVINNLQFVSNKWLFSRGFSIGLEDCFSNNSSNIINETIIRCFTEANCFKEKILHQGIREIKIQGALNKARDIGMKMSKDGLSKNNNFLSTVNSGSKGDFFNIAQISGLLGQQNFRGKRIEYLLNNGKRSLYHYDWDLKDDHEIYESQGFISNSFLKGLSPREMFFHALPGREGVTDTALNTGETGYMQRRIIKLMEDIHVKNDYSIRDENNKVYQYIYGECGFDNVGVAEINDLVNEINNDLELKN
jgi:DNA-directed RNA polymerase beta' subunit